MSEQVMEMMSLLRQINMRLHHCLKELYEPLGLTGPQAVVMIELFKEDGPVSYTHLDVYKRQRLRRLP